MNEVRQIYQIYKKDIFVCLFLVSFFQLVSIYIFNFLHTKIWFSAIQNFFTVIIFFIVLFIPYWFTQKIVTSKNIQFRGPLWLLGLNINLLLIILFVFWGTVDFIVKIFIFGFGTILESGNFISFVSVSVLGILIILSIGSIVSTISGFVIKKDGSRK